MILNKVKFGLWSLLLSLFMGMFVISGVVHAQSSVDGFDPNANYTVAVIAVQSDGKILMGGGFTYVGGSTRNYIARLNADGTLDTTFNPDANEWVVAIAVQSDGKILIGGNFTTLNAKTHNK